MALLPEKKKKKATSVWQMDVTDLLRGGGGKLSQKEVALFFRKAAFLFEAGLTINNSMPLLADQIKGRSSQIAREVNVYVARGESFSYALAKTEAFPMFVISYTEIGDHTGKIDLICRQLAEYYERRQQSEDEIKAALMYPIAVTIMMLGVIVLAITLVLPGYADVFASSGVDLPAITAGLIGLSNFVRLYFIHLLVGLIIVIALTIYGLRSDRGRVFLANLAVKIPILRMGINLNISRAISLLLGAGITITEALPRSINIVNNSKVAADLIEVSKAIRSGSPFWLSLDKVKYIDRLMVSLARIGEEGGSMIDTMNKCYTYLEESHKHALKKLNKLVEPVITLVLGIILALVMLAIILPTFELATAY